MIGLLSVYDSSLYLRYISEPEGQQTTEFCFLYSNDWGPLDCSMNRGLDVHVTFNQSYSRLLSHERTGQENSFSIGFSHLLGSARNAQLTKQFWHCVTEVSHNMCVCVFVFVFVLFHFYYMNSLC
jgi:hypothetical protein